MANIVSILDNKIGQLLHDKRWQYLIAYDSIATFSGTRVKNSYYSVAGSKWAKSPEKEGSSI